MLSFGFVSGMEDMEEASGSGSVGPAAPREHGELRDTLRELLFEISGFRALAERGISAELISPPPHGRGAGTPSERPRPAAAAVGRPRPTPGGTAESSATEANAESGTSKLESSSQIRRYILSL